jgi:hypothetical protein
VEEQGEKAAKNKEKVVKRETEKDEEEVEQGARRGEPAESLRGRNCVRGGPRRGHRGEKDRGGGADRER